MPRAKKPAKRDFVPTTFVRCELSSDEKKDVPRFMGAMSDELDTLVIEVLQSGHKIGFSFSEHNDSFVCSVTGKPDDCINASMCFTSHAKDYTTALWVALYKFHMIWQKGVWEEGEPESDFG